MRRLPSYRDEQLGVVYAPGQYPGMDDADSIRNRRRKRIFLSVVAVSLLVSLAWTLLRPAIYESRATLLDTVCWRGCWKRYPASRMPQG